MASISILFLAANPFSTTRLALDEEARAIELNLSRSAHRDSFDFRTRWAVRPDDVLGALNEFQPTIVHFSGHGSSAGSIMLHKEFGEAVPISRAALKSVFASAGRDVKLVLLNACFSREQAVALSSIVDCVIGMRAGIADEAACAFAGAFYGALGYGKSIRDAYDQGITAIQLCGLPDDSIPVLVARKGIDPAKLYLLWNASEAETPYERELREARAKSRKRRKREGPLYGKMFLCRHLPSIIRRFHHRGHVSLLLVDIDDLTVINKRHGTEVGDAVLQRVDLIVRKTEGIAYSARCGDDTFYAISLRTNLKAMKQKANELRDAISEFNWESIARNLYVTGSFGVAEWHKGEDTMDWIVRAGEGLLSAKKAGPNTIRTGPLYLPVPLYKKLPSKRDLWDLIS